jgi:hypothetical protein
MVVSLWEITGTPVLVLFAQPKPDASSPIEPRCRPEQQGSLRYAVTALRSNLLSREWELCLQPRATLETCTHSGLV